MYWREFRALYLTYSAATLTPSVCGLYGAGWEGLAGILVGSVLGRSGSLMRVLDSSSSVFYYDFLFL